MSNPEFSRNNSQKHSVVSKVTLPSGKKVDIVSFLPKISERNENADEAHGLLCTCPSCGHDRVQPTELSEAGFGHWNVHLRCPDCEERREATFGQDELDELDVVLDEGKRSIVADLDLLARANMADDVDRITAALRGGHILPEDF